MLELNNISTGYGKKQILFDVSLSVKQGEIVLLIGSNGSGKSTVLKTIYGLVSAWSGNITYQNQDINNASTSSLLKQGIMYVPQKNNCFDELTVKENLEVCGLILPKSVFKQRYEKVLDIFSSLRPILASKPTFLSGGERQQLILACAMLHEPKLLLLDEPLTGLSPKNLSKVQGILKMLNEKKGITMLIVEHHTKECLSIANKVYGLKLGKVVIENVIDKSFTINQLNTIYV
jgi:branched-chain amino acid transport system ATP-binding protein